MSIRQSFSKPALSIDEQILLLEQRGLHVNNLNLARHFLTTIGYYRLAPYFKPFLIDHADSEKGFPPNAAFSQILQLYLFDRELRLLAVDAIERIEVALRAAISNTMSITYGAHWYLDCQLFTQKKRHSSFLNETYSYLKRSKEDFIKKYYANYNHPAHPPSWMVMECLSFGSISQLYYNIKDRSCRKAVEDIFQQYSETVKSWMRALTFTRNICAHHSRLWNRFFVNTPKNVNISIPFDRDKSPFIIQAYIIIKLMGAIAPGNHWQDRLILLFEEHETLVPFENMGFGLHWRDSALWSI